MCKNLKHISIPASSTLRAPSVPYFCTSNLLSTLDSASDSMYFSAPPNPTHHPHSSKFPTLPGFLNSHLFFFFCLLCSLF